MQILVVGAGIQGLAISVALAREGHLVQLLERERPGSRASWVAAGLLTPSSPWRYPRALIDLCARSEALYPEFVADLLEHTGIDGQLERRGMLYPVGVGLDAEAIAEATARRRELGFDVQLVDRAELDGLQPGLGPEISAAAWQPDSARVRPPRLLAALVARARELGVDIASGADVRALRLDGERVCGVSLASGQALDADAVVLAAGAWSGALGRSVDVAVDVRPVRGQILLLHGAPGVLDRTVNDGDGYLVPREDGRILVGSTMEDAGFEAVTTAEALERLRATAARLLPATAAMREEQAWAGLRPGTADRLPFLGPVPERPGLVLATGHYRNGILLAPLTARLVADCVAERQPAIDLAPFAARAVDPDAALIAS